MKLVIICFLFLGTVASKECEIPALPLHAVAVTSTQSRSPSNSNFYYKCEEGYHFNGENQLQVQHKIRCENGKWEPEPLKCVDSCQNRCGMYGKCVSTIGVSGEVAKCQCDKGYAGLNCNLRVCEAPILNPHGTLKVVEGVGQAHKFSLGTRISYQCMDLFQITTGNTKAICTTEGWQPPTVPQCQEVTCKNLLSGLTFTHGYYTPMRRNYKIGSRVDFSCQAGYYLDGVTSATCKKGYWDSGEWPICRVKTCTRPPRIANGYRLSKPRYEFGSSIEYSCMSGYTLVGKNTVECMGTKITGMVTWKGTIPRCLSYKEFKKYCFGGETFYNLLPANKKQSICASLTQTTKIPKAVQNKSTSAEPLTIVTATAGGLLMLLLLVITLVACQRRRIARNNSRHGRLQRMNSDDDRYSFVYYSNDVHVVLPSYDEAMQARRPQPPSYNDSENRDALPAPTAEETALSNIEENAYEVIDEILSPQTQNQTSENTNGEDTHVEREYIPPTDPSSNELLYATINRDTVVQSVEGTSQVENNNLSITNNDGDDELSRASSTLSISSNENSDTIPLI